MHDATTLIVSSLRNMVRAVSDGDVTPADAVARLDFFAQVERLAVAGKTFAAQRAAGGEPWRGSGDRSAADWLARRTASTVGEARTVLEAAAQLDDAPRTAAAFGAGALSLKQAEAIASAASAEPSSEQRLLDAAPHQSLQKLRDESARVRAAADPDPAARHERIRRSRFWRKWTDADGARCGTYRMTPEVGAMFEAAAQPFVDAAIDDARRERRQEPSDALAADGLLAMAASTTTGDAAPTDARGARGRRRLRNRRELIALVDLAALQRGTVVAGETCEIAGVGHVPVQIARDVFGDAVLRIVIRDGVDVRTVVHTGRTASAVQETAVLVQQDGRCGKPHCHQPAVEIDHGEGYSRTGPVTVQQLLGLCGHDHDLKTVHGHRWRRDTDGSVVWVLPDGTEERERPPP